ncbi:MAG: substrate-binding domain-containing protein [Acidobacteria bacterium]|nr:substrate-binding domain-containing protein [Acidobacteriota bacterium]
MSESTSTEKTKTHPEITQYIPPPGLDAALESVPLVRVATFPAKIGYLTNYSFHIWYQIVIELLKRRGGQYRSEIVVRDAELSVERQIEQARELVKEVDVLILTPAATEGLEEVLKIAAEAEVPVVVEANPVDGMSTLVAICDYDAGYDMGVWVGRNVKGTNGPLRILDVGLPTLRPCLIRSEGFADGVRSIQPDAVVVASINGEATPSIARGIALETLKNTGDVDVIFAMDDETGQGAYQGYLDAGFDPETVTIAGFGLAGAHEKDWLLERKALKVSAAMFPEYVGLRCIDGAVRMYNGEEVPLRDVIPTIPMTVELLEIYYSKKDGVWTPNLNAIASIPTKSECTKV